MFKRLVTGSALSVIALFANIAVAMVMMPFIIHSLGDYDYGLWILVASFVGYYGLLDFGMSTAVTRFISRADGQSDVNEMNIILNTGSAFFAILGLSIFAISIIVALSVENSVTAILWLTVGITCIFQFGLRGFYGLFFARIRQDILSYTTLGKLTFRTILFVYFLSIGYGVIAVAVITMVSEILFYMIDMYILRRIVPEMRLSWDMVKIDRVKALINYGKFSMVLQIADLLKLRALPIIVTYTIGVANIVFFSVAIRLMEIFQQIITKIISILTPVFSQYEGRGNNTNIERVFWIAFRINLILTLLIGGGIALFSGNFIGWWIGEEYTLAADLTLVLTYGFIAFTMNEAGKTVLFGISKHQKFAWISAIESATAAIIGTIAGYSFGPIGIVTGMVVIIIGVEVFVKPYIICKEINTKVSDYYMTMFDVGLKMGTPILIWAFMLKDWYTDSILVIMTTACVFVVSLTASMWWSLGDDSRNILYQKIFSKLPFMRVKC